MRAAHDLTDDQLADLARSSIRASRAPEEDKATLAGRDRRLVGDNERMTHLPGENPAAARRTRSPSRPGAPEDDRRRPTPEPAPSRPSRSATGSDRRPSRRASRRSRGSPTPPRRTRSGAGVQPDQRPSRLELAAAQDQDQPYDQARTASSPTASSPYGQPVRPALRPAAVRLPAARPASRAAAGAAARLPAVRRLRAAAPRPPAGDARRWCSASSAWSAAFVFCGLTLRASRRSRGRWAATRSRRSRPPRVGSAARARHAPA